MLAGALAFLAAVRELFVLQVLSFVFIFAIYAQSWNLAAHSGQHSLGHATFLGLGSYGSILLATRLRVPPPVALFLGPLLPHRKSTRLNSRHRYNSHSVFCLK